MAEKLIGQNHVPSDLVAKVTGRAKYAEDFRAEGMVFAKLLLSPMPHARVRSIDASEAMAMEGVVGMITAEDLPRIPDPPGEAPLTREPLYEGEPILAVAAVDETTAADAIERIRVDLEPLPFVLDPLESLRPGGPDARSEGNVFADGSTLTTLKWSEEAFEAAGEDGFPMGEAPDEWSFGDPDAAFAEADYVLEETLYHQSLTHHPLEPRSVMAYWRNGKCYLHGSTQSVARTRAALADALDLDLEELVLIGEYCGGGFGSKIYGAYIMQVPAVLSRKVGRPVMLRVTRAEETYYGRARPGFQGHVRMGFRSDGKVKGIDLFLVQENGPYSRQGDYSIAGMMSSLAYQPEAMRFRGVAVVTNTPPKSAQRAPGGAQMSALFEPLMDKAARELGVDRLAIRRINAPDSESRYGGNRTRVTSAFCREMIDRGREVFGWEEKKAWSGRRDGSRVTGVGIGFAPFFAGSTGYDGLMVIRPDGKLYIHQGIGNLGTHSVLDTARAGAEALGMPWERCEVIWGDTSRGVPWSSTQSGSQTTLAHTRANHAAATDLKEKLREIAARELGGAPDDYEVDEGRVFRRGAPSTGIDVGAAARRAIELGGKYDGQKLPEAIHRMTVEAARGLAGEGVMGVAKDEYPIEGSALSYVLAFAVVELDRETGAIDVQEYTAVTDCGRVLHPRNLGAQLHGGGVQGMGMARSQNWYYDRRWGASLANRFYSSRPPGILDVPLKMEWDAVDRPDPWTPVGARGIGEPPICAGEAALTSAISDAMGGICACRTPLRPDTVLAYLEGRKLPHGKLEAHV